MLFGRAVASTSYSSFWYLDMMSFPSVWMVAVRNNACVVECMRTILDSQDRTIWTHSLTTSSYSPGFWCYKYHQHMCDTCSMILPRHEIFPIDAMILAASVSCSKGKALSTAGAHWIRFCRFCRPFFKLVNWISALDKIEVNSAHFLIKVSV